MPASLSAPAVLAPDLPIARWRRGPGPNLAVAGLLTLTIAAALTLGRGAIGLGGIRPEGIGSGRIGTTGPSSEPAAPVLPTSSPVAPAAVPVVEARVVTSSTWLERPDEGAPDELAQVGVAAVPAVGAAGSPGSASIPAGSAGASASNSGAAAVRWEVLDSGMMRVSLIPPTTATQPGLDLRVGFVSEPSTQREALYSLCGQGGAGVWDLVVDGPVASVDVLEPAPPGSAGGCAGGSSTGAQGG